MDSVTVYTYARRYSPILCRLLARHSGKGGAPLTTEEIARRSGLTAIRVATISEQKDWSGVDVWTMQRFTAACGIDFDRASSMRRIRVRWVRLLKSIRERRVLPLAMRQSPEWTAYLEKLKKP